MEQEITTSKDNNLELKSLFFKYLRYWYLFAISLALALGVWHYYMKYSVPVYQVKARFLVKAGGNDKNLTGTQDVFSGLGAGISNSVDVSNELEIIKSRFVVGKVVKALNLTVSYTIIGRIKNSELYDRSPIFLHIVSPKDSLPWKGFTIKFTRNSDSYQIQTGENTYKSFRYNDTVFYDNFYFVVVPNPQGELNSDLINVSIAPYDATVVGYLGGIDARNINDGTVILLTTNTTVPKKGEDIINTLYDVYSNISLEDKNRVIDSTVKFIDQRMEKLHEEITHAQDSVSAFLIRNKIVPPDASSLSSSISKAVSSMGDLSNTRYQLNLLEAFIARVKNGGYPIVPSDMDLTNADFKTYAQSYNAMVLSRSHYLEYSVPENPVLIDLENQISRAKVNLLAAANSEQIKYRTILNKSQKTLVQTNDTLSKVPVYQKIYQQLSNGLEVEQELYAMLLNKKESLDVYRAGSSSNSKLIDSAKCDAGPISPKEACCA